MKVTAELYLPGTKHVYSLFDVLCIAGVSVFPVGKVECEPGFLPTFSRRLSHPEEADFAVTVYPNFNHIRIPAMVDKIEYYPLAFFADQLLQKFKRLIGLPPGQYRRTPDP